MIAHSAPPMATITESPIAVDVAPAQYPRRKRKADAPENNERLSKRLSLLNLEQNGPRLYVPVQNPTAPAPPPTPTPSSSSSSRPQPAPAQAENNIMQVDDSKYKVYIYNLEDELSSESEPEDGKLVFLPDIDKHLRASRIPTIPPAVPPSSDGELAGMQLVLYGVPTSLTVPEEQDGVRKAIIEARARIRERQGEEMRAQEEASRKPAPAPKPVPVPVQLPPIPEISNTANSGFATAPPSPWGQQVDDDPDAMDLS